MVVLKKLNKLYNVEEKDVKDYLERGFVKPVAKAVKAPAADAQKPAANKAATQSAPEKPTTPVVGNAPAADAIKNI